MVLAIVAASFAVRFGVAEVVYDRYLFYVVPLLLVGAAAALERPSRRVAIGAGVVDGLFAASVMLLPFTTFPGVRVDSPASVSTRPCATSPERPEHGDVTALLVLLVGVVLVLGILLGLRAPLAVAVLVSLAVFSLLALRTEVNRIVDGTGLSGRPLAEPPGVVLDWVDSVVPEDAALVPTRSPRRGTRPRSAGGTSSSGTGAWCARISPRTGTSATRPTRT